FHDLVGLYARERLEADEASPDREEATVRLLDAYVAYGRRANAAIERWSTDPWDPPLTPRPPWLDDAVVMAVDRDPAGWLSRERAGLVAAVRHAHEAGLWEQIWNLAG